MFKKPRHFKRAPTTFFYLIIGNRVKPGMKSKVLYLVNIFNISLLILYISPFSLHQEHHQLNYKRFGFWFLVSFQTIDILFDIELRTQLQGNLLIFFIFFFGLRPPNTLIVMLMIALLVGK